VNSVPERPPSPKRVKHDTPGLLTVYWQILRTRLRHFDSLPRRTQRRIIITIFVALGILWCIALAYPWSHPIVGFPPSAAVPPTNTEQAYRAPVPADVGPMPRSSPAPSLATVRSGRLYKTRNQSGVSIATPTDGGTGWVVMSLDRSLTGVVGTLASLNDATCVWHLSDGSTETLGPGKRIPLSARVGRDSLLSLGVSISGTSDLMSCSVLDLKPLLRNLPGGRPYPPEPQVMPGSGLPYSPPTGPADGTLRKSARPKGRAGASDGCSPVLSLGLLIISQCNDMP
jgi:hypothetical protein